MFPQFVSIGVCICIALLNHVKKKLSKQNLACKQRFCCSESSIKYKFKANENAQDTRRNLAQCLLFKKLQTHPPFLSIICPTNQSHKATLPCIFIGVTGRNDGIQATLETIAYLAYLGCLKTLCRLHCNARVCLCFDSFGKREHCDKMTRFEPFSSQERK